MEALLAKKYETKAFIDSFWELGINIPMKL